MNRSVEEASRKGTLSALTLSDWTYPIASSNCWYTAWMDDLPSLSIRAWAGRDAWPWTHPEGAGARILSLQHWRYMKRTTVRGRGQLKSLINPKPPEKKAFIYFPVSHTQRDHVTHRGGMLIMLSEEDGQMLSPSAVTARHAGIEPTWAHLSPAAQILWPQFYSHRSLGGRKREGMRGGVAFWKGSYPRAQRSKTETLTVRAFSPTESSMGFPQAWHTLSMSFISVKWIPARLRMTLALKFALLVRLF